MTARRSKNDTEFGASVSKILTEAKVNQAYLASETKTSLPYVNQMLTGRKRPAPGWIDVVASTLKLQNKKRVQLHRAAAKDAGYDIDLTKE